MEIWIDEDVMRMLYWKYVERISYPFRSARIMTARILIGKMILCEEHSFMWNNLLRGTFFEEKESYESDIMWCRVSSKHKKVIGTILTWFLLFSTLPLWYFHGKLLLHDISTLPLFYFVRAMKDIIIYLYHYLFLLPHLWCSYQ